MHGAVGILVYGIFILWTMAVAVVLASTVAGALAAFGRGEGGRSRRPRRDVEFVIVSKASYGVLDALFETIRRVEAGFPGYRIWVVVDEGSEGIPYLKALARRSGASLRLVVVPSSYSKGAHKARALNYFAEHYAKPDRWYALLDDDSYPLDSNFLREIDEGKALVYVGILAPRRGRSLIAWLADSIRFHGDVTRNRFALSRFRKPLFGLHGDLLVVHGSVLKSIGFNTDSIAEDTWFAARLIERGIPVAQTSSRVSILSPGSVVDLWRQRSRWNLGVLRDLVKGRYPAPLALGKGLEIALWLTGPVTYFGAFFIVKGLLYNRVPHALAYAFLVGASLIVVVAYTLYPTLTAGLRGLVLSLLLLPVTTFIESNSVIYALIRGSRILGEFVVIDKTVQREAVEEPAAAIPLGAATLWGVVEPGRRDLVGPKAPVYLPAGTLAL